MDRVLSVVVRLRRNWEYTAILDSPNEVLQKYELKFDYGILYGKYDNDCGCCTSDWEGLGHTKHVFPTKMRSMTGYMKGYTN